jgi:hypothetical protein
VATSNVPERYRGSSSSAPVETREYGVQRDTEDRIMIALRAHGYGNVAEHPEQIFTDIAMAEDFVRKSGGSLRRCAVSGEFASVEILLPRTQATARWLAED